MKIDKARICKSIALALLCCFCLTACHQTDENALSDEELIEKSIAMEEKLRAGEYDAVVAEMDDTCASQISADQLAEIYAQLAPTLGRYLEARGTTEVSHSLGNASVSVYSKYLLYGTQTTFTYDQEGKISGLHIQFTSLPDPAEETDLYTEEVIAVGPHSLPGKLTRPVGVENPPVAILIQGSGTHDMDETIGAAGNKPFKDLAHGLAERGIASIRFDKRFYAKPALAATQGITIENEVLDDVLSAIDLAATLPGLDADRIYLIGHSLGGMVVPRIAAEDDRVVGIVSMAGTPRNLADLVVDQSREALEASGLSSAEIGAQMAAIEADRDKILSLDAGSDLNETLLGQPAAYWLSLNSLEPEQYATSLSIPILILQGSEDFQVYPDVDFAQWQEILAGKENVTFKLYDGLNHLFMPSEGIRDVSDYDREAHLDATVLDDLAAFIDGKPLSD